ncbi:helix-turn-helix domain-containing protein [Natrialbaceae archaeon AArc-T1-2]|uniref:helix-turn-helix domain-containing protein n=1 Tax=Natrialbaceae archaeon AArc-T1-2 TaxID=3053904 RepID=UPI00255AFF82|nr:helix-turn-helix domain-containing protein [Natrialbaceae archaeon AArc-T1-2]WIV65676.1 helix-turn-helix domain-containing protein [Natrialbaceae archaeon AArc-T1-2]
MSATPDDRLREFTFSLEYEPGTDPIADIVREHPTLEMSTIDVVLGDRSCIRLVQLTGPPNATDRLQTALEDRDYRPRSLGAEPCGGRSSWYRLECAPRRRLLYVYVEDVGTGVSVDRLAAAHVAPGTICESRCRDGTVWWRLLTRSDDGVGALYDHLETTLCEGVTLEMGHLGTATEWHGDGIVDVGLSGPQRQAIAAAAARGYYERPREVTLDELADELDVPESTLSYRLRMAESALVKHHLERFVDPDETPSD